MKPVLYDYDIYPLVFPVGKETEITLHPLGAHAARNIPNPARVVVSRLDAGSPGYAIAAWNKKEYFVTPEGDGTLRFRYTADAETEIIVRVFDGETRKLQMSVYAVNEDLADRLPFRGDLHMHTCRSDGREDPGTVCANYRARGYDFAVITDHHRYYPALEAMRVYKDAAIPLTILPGEEVHLPQTDMHIVNAGGLFSINGLFADRANYKETNGADEGRRLNDSVTLPPIVTPEQYERELEAIEAENGDCPDNVDKRWFAVAVWAYRRIHEAQGLCIFPHPYWIADMFHIPEPLTKYMMLKHPFDAFEVLGGENYYAHNGFQTALYYEEYLAGRVHPIVGSTDTHGSTEYNRNAAICSTIVFGRKCERADIVASIHEGKSVAVDTISKEYRLVGPLRLQKYACFLMENWYPLHDRLCAVDGELMRQYYVGDLTAAELSAFTPKSAALFRKYFALA